MKTHLPKKLPYIFLASIITSNLMMGNCLASGSDVTLQERENEKFARKLQEQYDREDAQEMQKKFDTEFGQITPQAKTHPTRVLESKTKFTPPDDSLRQERDVLVSQQRLIELQMMVDARAHQRELEKMAKEHQYHMEEIESKKPGTDWGKIVESTSVLGKTFVDIFKSTTPQPPTQTTGWSIWPFNKK